MFFEPSSKRCVINRLQGGLPPNKSHQTSGIKIAYCTLYGEAN